jgi:shikimate kinase
MKLIILYGPPGVGKLTVAQKLSEKTKYQLFHNHLTIEFVAKFYKLWSPKFWRTLTAVRIAMLETAAINKENIIFTFVYEKGTKDKAASDFISTYKNKSGEICLVQLTASTEELKKRVIDESRKKYSKLSDPQILEEYLARADLYATIPGENSLQIDTTDLSPDEVVETIIQRFNF